MRPHDTEMGEGGPSFPSTCWTVFLSSGTSQDLREESLRVLAERYWKPVYHYFRRRGEKVEDAKDLAQEFFCRLLSGEFVERADPAFGRFRTYCLTALDRFHQKARRDARRKKRRPEKPLVSLDLPRGEGDEGASIADLEQDTPEGSFDRLWAAEVFEQALVRTREALEGRPTADLYEVFRSRVLEGLSSAEIEARTGVPAARVDDRVHDAKKVFRKALRDVIRETVADERCVDAELAELRRWFRGG